VSIPSRIPRQVLIPQPRADLDPLRFTWNAGNRIVRVFNAHYSPRAFRAAEIDPSDPGRNAGRFHPFPSVPGGPSVPVLYGANSLEGAISETVFHDVPISGVKIIDITAVHHRIAINLAPTRDLLLADLAGNGLRRLGITRAELIDSYPDAYPQTAMWAAAIHDHPTRFDGIRWVSRQYDLSQAVVLFGDRVTESELIVPADVIPMPLTVGAGLDTLRQLADQAGITLTGS